ncbi:MAG: GGDEF domain-containing protein [Gammaproteobacteria bacterium]|nr:MAG: GGDEF domain-containing protein [Gammaproteobacteria bacterium]
MSLLISSVSSADDSSPDNSLPLPISKPAGLIGEYISVLSEAGKKMSLEQAKQAYQQGKFIRWDRPVLSFGIGSAPKWLVFEIENLTNKNISRRLIIENSWLDKADINILHNELIIRQLHLGDSYPFAERIIEHRFFAFDHDYAQGISQLFIRVETPDPMVLPIYFGTLEDSAKRDVFNSYSYGLLYGIVTALLLYNFILYIQLRLRRYLFYVIYLAMFILMNQSYTGHTFYLFWPESVLWQQWMNPFLITLYACSSIVFAFLFLHTERLFPRIFKKTLISIVVLLIVQLILFLTGAQSLTVIIAIAFVIFFALFTIFMALITWRYIPQEVSYFLIASIATLIGSTITAMTVFGFIPYYEVTYRAIEIGLSVDVILLSIALAAQFRHLQNEKQLAEQLARIDPLTGLFNRRAFYEAAEPILHNSLRYDHSMSVIIFDIDKFKLINDQYGHNFGDEVIKFIAELIQKIKRKSDVSVRWGGEEFVILLPETGIEQARALAERLRSNIKTTGFKNSDMTLPFTVSLGVAQMSEEVNSIEQLIKLADTRLYQAKENGRNQVC